jgi:hypothetical protein
VPDLVQAIDQLGSRIFQMIFCSAEEGVDDNEAVFRYRAGKHRTPTPAIERGDIRAATGKAYAKGCAGDDHD